MALSSPTSNSFDNDDNDENTVLSNEEETEIFEVSDCDNKILENDSDSKVEKVTETPENNDNYVYSNTEQLSFNWTRSSDEILSMVNKHIAEMNQIVSQIENIPDEECSFESVVVLIERKIFNSTMDLYLQTSLSSFHPSEEIRNITGNNVGKNIKNDKFEGATFI